MHDVFRRKNYNIISSDKSQKNKKNNNNNEILLPEYFSLFVYKNSLQT